MSAAEAKYLNGQHLRQRTAREEEKLILPICSYGKTLAPNHHLLIAKIKINIINIIIKNKLKLLIY